MTSPSDKQPRKSILVVDDDVGMRAAIYDALSLKYDVTLAVDGIDTQRRVVHTIDGPELPYDYLILATGSVAKPRVAREGREGSTDGARDGQPPREGGRRP